MYDDSKVLLSNKKLKPASTDNILVGVPDVNRERLAPKNELAVVFAFDFIN